MHQVGEMTDLGEDELFHREPASSGRAGQRCDELSLTNAGDCSAHECRRTDFRVGEHPEQFAEAGKFLIEQSLHDLGGTVARRDAGASGDDHRVEAREVLHDSERDALAIIGHDFVERHAMTRILEHLGDQLSAGIIFWRARVAGGQDPHFQIRARVPFVFLYTHCF